MSPRIRKLTFCMLVIFLVSFFPTQVASAQIISGTETWTTDRVLSEDLIIDGHLTIASGVTITFECAADEIFDAYNLIVNSGGQLNADGVTFQGDGSAGCWGGIVILSGDDQAVIQNSVIRDVWVGLTISDSSPTISGNEIHNIKGPDDTDPGDDGYSAAGITILSSTVEITPIIQNNHIHHIMGGAGADGAAGADATDPAFAGENGEVGGDGGEVVGIKIADSNTNAVIQGNTIEYLMGGACGIGGDGGNGAAGVDGAAGGEQGRIGGDAGHGGQGGAPGKVYGIYAYGTANTHIIDNEIAYLTQPDACTGGDGGTGGEGGRGADGDDVTDIAGGQGGSGGLGGSGGASSANDYGVTGIFVMFPSGTQAAHDTISGNTLHDFQGGDSVPGGAGGIGGRSGDGGDGAPASGLGTGDGGPSVIGGIGGNGGASSGGFNAIGIILSNIELSVESNTIYNLTAGGGSEGGTASDGGTGGTGGAGGYYVIDDYYGNGGDGGMGGTGGQGGAGGDGGHAIGIVTGGDNATSLNIEIFNNDIWVIHGGEGGDSGLPGNGGAGGNGGDTLDPGFGVAGNGGDGGRGGPGCSGGDAGYGVLILLNTGHANVYNNTLVDATAYETGGAFTAGGAGGMYGSGGLGGTDGLDGSVGSVGLDIGKYGNGNQAVGVLQLVGDNLTNVYNNILYLSDSTPENTYAFNELDATFASLDYNNLYGWHYTESTTANGSNTIYSDPLFVSASDHNLESGSPCIDAGTNAGAPSEDIAGNARPFDGDGNHTATVDVGAFERQTVNEVSPCYLPLFLR